MPERRISADLREQVSVRAGGCCEYCRSRARYATQSFSVEHILPRVQGGATTLDNLALACQGCNGYKLAHTTAVDPRTGTESPLFHPRKMRWGDHFAWGADGLHIIGLTTSGRATVRLLRLNRPGLLALREMLIAAGRHPPGRGE